jgi:4-amino-4-deoxy-L-arabinose transferase-like glycosyltransferase
VAIMIAPSRLMVLGFLLFLLACSCFLLFYRLGERELVSSHEARAAQDAQTILLDDRWELPALFDRKVELQKPPLYYWMVAGIARLRGGRVDALAVRLPAALAAVGGVLAIYLLGILRGRFWAGAIAALVLLTMMHYTWLGRVGRIDMPLTFMATVCLCGFYLGNRAFTRSAPNGLFWEGKAPAEPVLQARQEPCPPQLGDNQAARPGAWMWFLLAYVAMAFAILLKGPIGVVLSVTVVGVSLLYNGQLPAPWKLRDWLSLLHRFGLWWGVGIVILIASPWYLWANARTHGAFFEVFFWKHNIERGLGGGSLQAHPWWFYVPRLAIDLAPWSLLIPVSAWLCIRRRWWGCDPEARWGLIWLSTMLLVLSCSQFKRADYLLPAYPGAALFLGCMIERWVVTSTNKKAILGLIGAVVLSCVLGWVVFLGLVKPGRAMGQKEKQFATEVRRRAPAPQLILFFRTEDHILAFHVGRPIDTILEWQNLDSWAARPEIYHVVMPSEYATQWQEHLKKGGLKEVTRSGILGGSNHSDPLVLLRTHPEAESPVP